MKIPQFQSVLAMDALYIKLARDAYQRALEAEPAIKESLHRWQQLEAREQSLRSLLHSLDNNEADEWTIAEPLGDDEARWDYDESEVRGVIDRKLEELAIQLVEGVQYDIDCAYARQIENLVQVHVSATSAAEAHINILAKDYLTGTEYEHFDKLSLEGKWLFLPRIAGWSSFEPGAEPFQSFSRAVGYRNRLAHYKTRREPWKQGVAPGFLEPLGLTLEEAWASMSAVEIIIRDTFERRGVDMPSWIGQTPESYFVVEVVWDKKDLH